MAKRSITQSTFATELSEKKPVEVLTNFNLIHSTTVGKTTRNCIYKNTGVRRLGLTTVPCCSVDKRFYGSPCASHNPGRWTNTPHTVHRGAPLRGHRTCDNPNPPDSKPRNLSCYRQICLHGHRTCDRPNPPDSKQRNFILL
jgi:hypothetical protein